MKTSMKAVAKGKRVLVVDDEPESVFGVVYELGQRHFRVEEAHSRKEAIDFLSNQAYDAVLLDLLLPVEFPQELATDPPLAENGMSILRSLLASHFEPRGTPHVCAVFVVTALRDDTEALAEVRQLGVRIFGKPTEDVFIAESIRIALEKKAAC